MYYLIYIYILTGLVGLMHTNGILLYAGLFTFQKRLSRVACFHVTHGLSPLFDLFHVFLSLSCLSSLLKISHRA